MTETANYLNLSAYTQVASDWTGYASNMFVDAFNQATTSTLWNQASELYTAAKNISDPYVQQAASFALENQSATVPVAGVVCGNLIGRASINFKNGSIVRSIAQAAAAYLLLTKSGLGEVALTNPAFPLCFAGGFGIALPQQQPNKKISLKE